MGVLEALTKLVIGMSRLGDYLLRQKVSGIIVATLAFACGAGLAHALRREPPAKQVAPAAAPANGAATAAYAAPPPVADSAPADGDGDEDSENPALREWKNLHSGTPLPLDYEQVSKWGELSESKVVMLPSGRALVGAGNTLYMLGAGKRVIWKHDLGPPIKDFAYVKATSVICGTAYDNTMFILDASTGDLLFSDFRNGGGGYGAVIPYGEDACLITDALSWYRQGYTEYDPADAPTQDGVTAWRGTRMLWRLYVPPDAELQVVGSKIYAVTKTRDRILLKELRVPEGTR